MAGRVDFEFPDGFKGRLRNEPWLGAVVCLSSVDQERVTEIDIAS